MVQELEITLEDFSEDDRSRCFLHIVNLIAKSFLQQFEASKKRGEANDELESLVQEVMRDEMEAAGDDGNDEDTDDDDDDSSSSSSSSESDSAHESHIPEEKRAGHTASQPKPARGIKKYLSFLQSSA